ncbi:protein Wnt-4-like [Uloborus diversus]|uniref:protein Wnt-4-like n=1 Tax=Uloborus diversus TaxID=327109 RepID=UPI00240A1CD4|nr:protein Wnt-4-like [Uloborus diversus]
MLVVKSLTVFLLLLPKGLAIRWMALLQAASLSSVDQTEQCDNLPGLTKRQVKICKKNLEVMDSVRLGAEAALKECQWQFRGRRWNCSTISNSTKIFGKALAEGTREAAFVHALSSAGVAHTVTRSCSSGGLGRCGCDRTVRGYSPEGFQWSGCSDNVAFGSAFSKSFVDIRELKGARGPRPKPSSLVNLHNNEAGRKILEYNMKIECKCHGVSGSCETRTCWRALPEFRRVGTILLQRYDNAAEARRPGQGKRNSQQPLSAFSFRQQHSDTDLVYLQASTDFCDAPGTFGRPCNSSLGERPGGCDLLCCGRGHSSRSQRVRERCECKFHWCCYVKCMECEREVEINYCH